jgi:hypothetical protein
MGGPVVKDAFIGECIGAGASCCRVCVLARERFVHCLVLREIWPWKIDQRVI